MTDIIITKEEFCKIMKQIEEQRKKVSDFSDALDKVCDGFVVFDSNNQYFEALLFLLNKTFNLKDQGYGTTLEWFLFEGTGENSKEHKMYFENREVNIDSYEKLYELLITEKAQVEDNNLELTRDFFSKYEIKEKEDNNG